MACHGLTGDYLCRGWRERSARIRERDGKRCRGCNRGEDEIRLETHHRVYGTPGACGECYLTGVSDDDLITLCIYCHDGITDVRRRARYGSQTIEVSLTAQPMGAPPLVKIRTEVTPDVYALPAGRPSVTRRSIIDIIG